MSLSFKRVASVAEGNLRTAEDEQGNVFYKFIGNKSLTLDEVKDLLKKTGSYSDEVTVSDLSTSRSGYKFKTTWTLG